MLADVCNILDSKRIPITRNKRLAGPYPYYGANGIQDYVADYIFDDELVLLAEDGGHFEGGRQIAYRVSGKCWVNNHAHVLKAKKNIDTDYLYFALRCYDVTSLTNGATRKKLTQAAMKRILLPLRSINDQLYIVNNLKSVEAQLESARNQLSKLDGLVKSRFVEMFGRAEDEHSVFPVKTLDDVCASIVRGPFGSALKKEFFVPKGPGVYKVYEQKHAIRKQIDIGTYYISSDRFETLKRFECHPGDILMSCSGTMGRLYQLPPNCEPGVMNQALCKFTLSDSILVDYFLGFMEQVVDELGAKGSGIKNVSSVKFIKAIRIPLPPVELQGRFAAFVSQVDKSRFIAQQQIEKLQMLYDSLAQDYFGD